MRTGESMKPTPSAQIGCESVEGRIETAVQRIPTAVVELVRATTRGHSSSTRSSRPSSVIEAVVDVDPEWRASLVSRRSLPGWYQQSGRFEKARPQ